MKIAISRNTSGIRTEQTPREFVHTRATMHSRTAKGLAIGVKKPIRMNTPVKMSRTLDCQRARCDTRTRKEEEYSLNG